MTMKNERRHRHFAHLTQEFLERQPADQRLHLQGPGTNSLAAWFLGPRAENSHVFATLIQLAIDANSEDRNTFYEDPPYVTAARKDEDYLAAVVTMEEQYRILLGKLKGSVPFFSYRYQAHMNWDLTMPAMLGYFAAMLYNQNNVALEASPVTSVLEKLVGDDLCQMLGFDISATNPKPWGHITCDGSVANLEAMWAARNLKYYPISIKAALQAEKILAPAKAVKITLGTGQEVALIEQDTWTLMNLAVDDILALPNKIQAMCKIDAQAFSTSLDPYLLQTLGIEAFMAQYAKSAARPVVMGPATKHYSWPKNAALTGIGKCSFIDVPVDDDARMDADWLDNKLAQYLDDKQPVFMVVAVLGSTEESAVDPLARILAIRMKYRKLGLDFLVHVDGAWGGYFASILHAPDSASAGSASDSPKNAPQVTPVLSMNEHVTSQYRAIPGADSVTIDPHKAGYVPYAAGGLCYRNKALRNLVAFLAPEVYHDDPLDSNMGIFGVEGSKPGAAAAGVYLSHRVIRPNQSGYGKILGQALFNSKRFFAAIVTMATEKDAFVVVPVQQIPAERSGGTPDQIKEQLKTIRDTIVTKQNNELIGDPCAMKLLGELGSDQIIITYGLNFKVKSTGKLNTNVKLANDFMHEVFCKLSMKPDATQKPELIITTSEFGPHEYGEKFVANYMRRLGLGNAPVTTMNFLSSTTMCPWLTATAEGNFIPTLIAAFRKAITEVLATARFQ